jgi:hypothetical protein
MYTRETWSRALLAAIGNTTPDLKVVEWVVAWTLHETTRAPGAAYNLLNTTEPNTPGVVSNFNSVGVKNYDSFEHGIQANAKVLKNSLYPTLLTYLSTGDTRLFTPNIAVNNDLTVWGTGKVLVSINTQLGQGMTDEFPGEAPGVPIAAPSVPTAWHKYLPFLRFDTGIAKSWNEGWATYGSPLTIEIHYLQNAELVVQEFEHATCFWISGVAHWRLYP